MTDLQDALQGLRLRFALQRATSDADTLEQLLPAALAEVSDCRSAMCDCAHSIAGMAGLLGLSEISETARTVERIVRRHGESVGLEGAVRLLVTQLRAIATASQPQA
jgi:HPt (histidine-containing phosphotransfer) domain-containing protein